MGLSACLSTVAATLLQPQARCAHRLLRRHACITIGNAMSGARLDASGRSRLFKAINDGPTLFEMVMGQGTRGGVGGTARNRQEPV